MRVDVDFSSLRPWGGSQAGGFEELCCQIARARADGRGDRFVRLGTPDGGIEGYASDTAGNERALQAKFFLGKPTPGQWRELTASIERALSTHPRLIQLEIALPVDRADPRRQGEQWFMDEWNEHVTRWTTLAKRRGMSVEFEFFGKSELLTELTRAEHVGRYQWWFNRSFISDDWLANRWAQARANAGPRYNPQLHIAVPIGETLEAFSRSPRLLRELQLLRDDVVTAPTRLRRRGIPEGVISELESACQELPQPLYSDLTSSLTAGHNVDARIRLEAVDVPPFDDWAQAWDDVKNGGGHLLWLCQETPRDTPAAHLSQEKQLAGGDIAGGILSQSERAEHLLTVHAKAYESPALLITGKAGSGKTHLLCDMTRIALDRGQPSILVLGQQLGPHHPWQQILSALDFTGSTEEFLQSLSARAEACGQRALLIIDALNENNGPVLWRNTLAGFLATARQYPWIGVILSVRDTFASSIVSDHLDSKILLRVAHDGFINVEFNAIATYFAHYRLPLPTAPLGLLPEFTNPLFLRLYCTAAGSAPHLLDSPAPGFNAVIEAALDAANQHVSTTIDADHHAQLAQRACSQLARSLRARGRNWLSRAEATELLTPLHVSSGYSTSLLFALIHEGVLAEDALADERGATQQVVRFAFERLGDHLIATAILDEELASLTPAAGTNADEEATWTLERLRTSESIRVLANSPTARGVLAALAVLLPERVGVELATLFCALAEDGQLTELPDTDWEHDTWLDSLLLRAPRSVTATARDRLRRAIVEPSEAPTWPPSESRRDTIAVALTLAMHPAVPLGPLWLHEILAPLPMPERDRCFTAGLSAGRWRKDYSPYQPLLNWLRDWAARPAASGSSPQRPTATSTEAVAALMWALASPDRCLRDDTTRTLVALSDHDPRVATDLVTLVSNVDDPYIVERALAVLCGATTRTRDPIRLAGYADTLRTFVHRLGIPTHVLARDYLACAAQHLHAHGTLDQSMLGKSCPPYDTAWSAFLGRNDLGDLHHRFAAARREASLGTNTDPAHTLPPTANSYATIISSLTNGHFGHHVMKFVNRTSTPWAAQRLSEPDNGYVTPVDTSALLPWVFTRVLDLGWRPEHFGQIDAALAQEHNSARSPGKPERFGMKYQWIAWHETTARLSDTHRLRRQDDPGQERTYRGAWQIGARDFDPTHCLDWLTVQMHPRFPYIPAEICHEYPDYPDHLLAGPMLATIVRASHTSAARATFTTETDRMTSRTWLGRDLPEHELRWPQGPWWFPVTPTIHSTRRALPSTAELAVAWTHEQAEWVNQDDDLIDPTPLLTVTADLDTWTHNRTQAPPATNDRNYVVLHARHSTDWSADGHPITRAGQQEASPHRQLTVSLSSVLINEADAVTLIETPLSGLGTVPISANLLTANMFLTEWPASPECTNHAQQNYNKCDCSPLRPHERPANLPIPRIPLVDYYHWKVEPDSATSTAGVDHSLIASTSVALLSSRSISALGLTDLICIDGIARSETNRIVAADPSSGTPLPPALLIDSATLSVALKRNRLALVQFVVQRKAIMKDPLGCATYPGTLTRTSAHIRRHDGTLSTRSFTHRSE
ncbi:hypothetical protein [Kutzneria sp. 744]|uniref:hypothetical protein n=1 Tax=Kutzneria sp. (strain 744) TaxID=345341 RepID=UPI0003EED6A9|nr:hypothetical protein [Kutzneria sp. 744]EWM19858.1 hypothetical protein KUTG_10162 [Kutzneria sp. 744]